jgi:EAL domain-containing protein (putative c-di-GMP-specific phosphodiesterase class I)
VNLSVRQCQHPDLVPALAAVLADTGADPADICLELTETSVMEDLEGGLGVLDALKDLGFGLAIDDFGSGSSCLRALQHFPLDAVKIARASVAGVLADPQEAAIVGAVVAFAHALELEAVAAGLETVAQVDRLRALGCDRAQGFYFAQPAPAAELERMLAASS